MYLALLEEIKKELEKLKFQSEISRDDGYFEVLLWDKVEDTLIKLDKKHKIRIEEAFKHGKL